MTADDSILKCSGSQAVHELQVDKAVSTGAGMHADELHVMVPVTVANRTDTNLMVSLLKRTDLIHTPEATR